MSDRMKEELSPSQLNELRHCDGLETAQERSNVDGEVPLARVELMAELCDLSCPSLASAVMHRLRQSGLPVRAAFSSGPEVPGPMAQAVMGALGVGRGVGAVVADAIVAEAGAAPSLWAGLSSTVGGLDEGESGLDLKNALYAEAVDGSGPISWMRASRRFGVVGAVVGVGIAVAAALMLSIVGVDGPSLEGAMGPMLAAPVDIESLDVGDQNTVQVLQFGLDSPTIIFIASDIEVGK
jgi:hypothetical protein